VTANSQPAAAGVGMPVPGGAYRRSWEDQLSQGHLGSNPWHIKQPLQRTLQQGVATAVGPVEPGMQECVAQGRTCTLCCRVGHPGVLPV
jgi:hypothetical protein